MKATHIDKYWDSPICDIDDEEIKRHSLFTKEDDEKLKNIVEKYYQNDLRKVNWSFVSFQMSNKNKRQCKDRYINYLRDGINCDKFSPEENYLLLCKVEEIGHKWRMISKFFLNRTDIMIKAQYRKLIRHNVTKENVRYITVDKRKKKVSRNSGCSTKSITNEISNVVDIEDKSFPDVEEIFNPCEFIDIEDFSFFYE